MQIDVADDERRKAWLAHVQTMISQQVLRTSQET